MPCIETEEHYDETISNVATKALVDSLGCAVQTVNTIICTNGTLVRETEYVFEAKGPHNNRFNWDTIPLSCMQMHIVPRKSFDSPEWDNQT